MIPVPSLLSGIAVLSLIANAPIRARFAIVNATDQPMTNVTMVINNSSVSSDLGTIAPGERIEPRLPLEGAIELVEVRYQMGDAQHTEGCGPVGSGDRVTLTIGRSCDFEPQ